MKWKIEKERDRSGDWSRSSREWSERRRIEKVKPLSLRSFSLSLSLGTEMSSREREIWIVFSARALLLMLLCWRTHCGGGVGVCNMQKQMGFRQNRFGFVFFFFFYNKSFWFCWSQKKVNPWFLAFQILKIYIMHSLFWN